MEVEIAIDEETSARVTMNLYLIRARRRDAVCRYAQYIQYKKFVQTFIQQQNALLMTRHARPTSHATLSVTDGDSVDSAKQRS